MSKRKDMLAENQDYVSEWSDMSTGGLLLQWDITIKIQPPVSVLVYYKSKSSSSHRNVTLPQCCCLSQPTWLVDFNISSVSVMGILVPSLGINISDLGTDMVY